MTKISAYLDATILLKKKRNINYKMKDIAIFINWRLVYWIDCQIETF